MDSIEKSKYKEIIERSYNRNGGDIELIVQDTKLPLRLVYQEVQKLKKKENFESHTIAVSHVVKKVDKAYDKSDQRFDDLYHYLDVRTGTFFSSCCDTRVILHEHSGNSDGEPVFVCSKCMKPCTHVYLNPKETIDLKMRILVFQQKLIDSYVKNMDTLGVSERVEAPTFKIGNMTRITVNKGNKGQKEDYIELDAETESDIEALEPMDRERIIKKIEGKIMDEILKADAEDAKKENDTQKPSE